MSKRNWLPCLRVRFAVALTTIVVGVGCFESLSDGQTISAKESQQILEIVQRRLKSDHLAGIAVCVVEKGKTTYCQAFGYAEMESQRPLTTDTPFQLASLSKQFAATSIMLLVRDGKLTLDDPIGRHLENIPDDWKQITVKQLLAHTAGIKDYTEFPNMRADYQKDVTREQMLDIVFGFPLDFEPGSKFSYSNSGYTIVGCLIEELSGMDYGTFLKRRIFEPLAMKTARLEPVQNSDPARAIGYDYGEHKFRLASYNSPTWAFAAGGIVGSINDLAKWDAAIDSNVLLTSEQKQILWSPQKVDGKSTGFGLGWMVRPGPAGKHFVLHLGNKPGFSAAMARLVEDRLTIAVLSNRTEGNSSNILDEIGKMLLAGRAN